MVGRLLRTADFERVLARQPCSRSTHFAVHHVADRPSRPCAARTESGTPQLSTGDAPSHSPSVDDSAKLDGCWLGTVVPKRHARRSVTRSLLKRQMRAALEREVPRLAAGLWVVRLRAPFDPRRFPSAASMALRHCVRTELVQLLQRAASIP